MNAAMQYAEELRTFAPIEYETLRFYPLAVKHFALYQNAKAAMEIMLSTLPIQFVRLSWIQALEALDREAQKSNIATGYLGSFLLLLATALRLDLKDQHSIMLARGEDGKLSAIVVRQSKENAPVALTGKHFNDVREILAAQNGFVIPDENWNPELVKAQAYIRNQQSGTGSGGSLEDAVFALAAATGQRPAEIWDWPIREFTQMQSAVDRRLRFMLCGAAELSGQIKFTKGNPYPTWIWENRGNLPHGFKSLNDLDKEAGGTLALPNN